MVTVLDSTLSIHPALPEQSPCGRCRPEGLLERRRPAGGAPSPGAGFGGLCPPSPPSSRSQGQARAGAVLAAPGTGQQAEGLLQYCKENHSLLRGRSFWITHFSVRCSPTLPLIIV